MRSAATVLVEEVRGLTTSELGLLYGLCVLGDGELARIHLPEMPSRALASALKAMDRMGEDERQGARKDLLAWGGATLGEDWRKELLLRPRTSLGPASPQCVPGEVFHVMSLLGVQPHRLGAVLTHMGLFAFAAIVVRYGPRHMVRSRQEVGAPFIVALERYVEREHHLDVAEVDLVQQLYIGMSRYFGAIDERLARLGIYLLVRAIGDRYVEVLPILWHRLGSPLGDAVVEYHRSSRQRPSRISEDVAWRAFKNFPIHDFL